MPKNRLQTKNIIAETGLEGSVVRLNFINCLTQTHLTELSDGFSLCYKLLKSSNKLFLDESGLNVVSFTESSYILQSPDKLITIEMVWSQGESDTLKKRVSITSKADIEIIYVTVGSISCKGSKFSWQAPFAGKTYLPQSIARLGQPIYIEDFFFGLESPVGENLIKDEIGYCRYHVGRKLSELSDDLSYSPPAMVIGGGTAPNLDAMRRSFFNYISAIARPSKFRIQYNSWYDNMLDIDSERIKDSFTQVHDGLKAAGLRDLDCYVVDDGWVEYEKPLLWEFNKKFPNGFEPESKLTKSLDSKFGVWFGPRGGYSKQTIKFARLLKKIGYHVNNRSYDICTGDKHYIKDLCDKMASFCTKYNVEYFKIDGFAKCPCRAKKHNHPKAKGEGITFYTFLWEEWIKGFERIRETNPDVCLNITSYAHCSPWFLKWVDFLWMNNAADMGYDGSWDNLAMCLTYRDGKYRDFYETRQLQFPAAYLYNHEPCYAFKNINSKSEGAKNATVTYTDEQFRTYLKCCMMRGSGLAELYFSPGMMDGSKWNIAAEVLTWAEKNFDILCTSQFFGGVPEKGEVYGYSAAKDGQYIVMIRNSGDKPTNYTFDLSGVGIVTGTLKPYEIKFLNELS